MGRLGFMLDEETSEMVAAVCEFANLPPYALLQQSIETLYNTYLKMQEK